MRPWIVLVAVGAGVLLSACTGQDGGPVVTTVTVAASSDPQLPALPPRIPLGSPDTPAQTQTQTQVSTAAQPIAKFPNTTQTVWITGFDDKQNMIKFRLVRRPPGGPIEGPYALDSRDPSEHLLALADNPKVLSAKIICPADWVTADDHGRGTAPCSKDRLLLNVKQGVLLLTEIKVDGTQHVTAVTELYTP